jgi:hypothetical protein
VVFREIHRHINREQDAQNRKESGEGKERKEETKKEYKRAEVEKEC